MDIPRQGHFCTNTLTETRQNYLNWDYREQYLTIVFSIQQTCFTCFRHPPCWPCRIVWKTGNNRSIPTDGKFGDKKRHLCARAQWEVSQQSVSRKDFKTGGTLHFCRKKPWHISKSTFIILLSSWFVLFWVPCPDFLFEFHSYNS